MRTLLVRLATASLLLQSLAVAQGADGTPPTRAVLGPQLDVSLALGAGSRLLAFEDDRFRTSATYEVPATPLLAGALRGSWPLGALLGAQWRSGVQLAGDVALAPQAAEAGGKARGEWRALRFGPWLGVVFGGTELDLGVELNVQTLDAGTAALPVVGWTGPRARVDVIHRLERLQLGVSAALGPSVAGAELTSDSYYPRASLLTLEVAVDGAYWLTPRTAVGLRLGFRRLSGALHPDPSDSTAQRNVVAGGVLERQELALLFVTHRLGGAQ